MRSDAVTGSKVWITIAVMCGALMSVLDISIVNVALSDIRASFGTPLDEIAWVSTGYMMANIVVIPMTGWLQRRFGYKRYFTASILIFTAASVLCGLAWNLPSLVAFRALQGMGGGAIIPTSQAILFARYPREEYGMAGAFFGLGAITGPLLGPTLGGYLIEIASWHWIFLINLPVGLIAATISFREIKQPAFEPSTEPVDFWGVGLLAVGMGSLQYVLEEGNRDGWFESPLIVVLSVASAVCLITFVVHELETPYPIVDLRVFKNVSYAAASSLNFITGTALFSGSFLFSLYCGAVMHYSAMDIGVLFLKGSLIQIVLMPLIGRFGSKVDGRYLVAFGMAMMCWSLSTNGLLTSAADQMAMVKPIFIRACGLGFVFVPLSVIALSDLRPEQRGNGAGLYNLTRELGGSIGTAWMSTALDRNTKEAASALNAHVNTFDAASAAEINSAHVTFTGRVIDPVATGNALLAQRVGAQALIRAFGTGFWTLTVIFGAAILLVTLLKKADPAAASAGAH